MDDNQTAEFKQRFVSQLQTIKAERDRLAAENEELRNSYHDAIDSLGEKDEQIKGLEARVREWRILVGDAWGCLDEAEAYLDDPQKFAGIIEERRGEEIHVIAKAAKKAAESALAAEREAVAQWMVAHSYSTGHGDTVRDLLEELSWQVKAEREEKERLREALEKSGCPRSENYALKSVNECLDAGECFCHVGAALGEKQ